MCFFTNLFLPDVATLRRLTKRIKDTGDDQGRNYRHENCCERGSLPKEVEEAGAPVSQELQRVNLIVKNFFLGGHHFAKAISRTRVLTENDSGAQDAKQGVQYAPGMAVVFNPSRWSCAS
jgi:hypothetical protein